MNLGLPGDIKIHQLRKTSLLGNAHVLAKDDPVEKKNVPCMKFGQFCRCAWLKRVLSFSLVELLLSVNGDTTNKNGLRATKQVPNAGYFIVLSFSATVHLEPWQTLYLMIRGTGAGSFEVVNGSTFGVALIGKKPSSIHVANNAL